MVSKRWPWGAYPSEQSRISFHKRSRIQFLIVIIVVKVTPINTLLTLFCQLFLKINIIVILFVVFISKKTSGAIFYTLRHRFYLILILVVASNLHKRIGMVIMILVPMFTAHCTLLLPFFYFVKRPS